MLDQSDVDGAPWTVDAVHGLVDKSFVRLRDGDRFDLLVSVQACAAEHLQTPGRFAGNGPAAVAAAQARHVRWFGALGPARATDALVDDLDKLVTACRRVDAHRGGAQGSGDEQAISNRQVLHEHQLPRRRLIRWYGPELVELHAGCRHERPCARGSRTHPAPKPQPTRTTIRG